ncbi:hypothetical protein [Streptomyces cinereoruber]|uniref:hypothetical protein n=1 Tax=Streptomyces cinereoruber TaxID=67260 RepID=UPI0036386110
MEVVEDVAGAPAREVCQGVAGGVGALDRQVLGPGAGQGAGQDCGEAGAARQYPQHGLGQRLGGVRFEEPRPRRVVRATAVQDELCPHGVVLLAQLRHRVHGRRRLGVGGGEPSAQVRTEAGEPDQGAVQVRGPSVQPGDLGGFPGTMGQSAVRPAGERASRSHARSFQLCQGGDEQPVGRADTVVPDVPLGRPFEGGVVEVGDDRGQDARRCLDQNAQVRAVLAGARYRITERVEEFTQAALVAGEASRDGRPHRPVLAQGVAEFGSDSVPERLDPRQVAVVAVVHGRQQTVQPGRRPYHLAGLAGGEQQTQQRRPQVGHVRQEHLPDLVGQVMAVDQGGRVSPVGRPPFGGARPVLLPGGDAVGDLYAPRREQGDGERVGAVAAGDQGA